MALAAIVGYAIAGDVVPAPGGAYIEAAVGAPRYLNPLLAEPGSPDEELDSLIYSGLTRVEPEGEVRPDLAVEWRVSADGRQYFFRLRPDARWHDGRSVTPDDVVATVRMLQAADFPGDPALAGLWRGITVDAAGGEVRFGLPRANAWFPEQASLGVLPKHIFAGASGRDLLLHDANARAIGSGPFRVATAERSRVQLERFDEYHGRRPLLGVVEMRFYGSTDAAASAVRSGEANALRPVLANTLSGAPPDGIAPFQLEERGRRQWLVFNTRSAPFDDPAWRRSVVALLSGGSGSVPDLRFTIVTNDRQDRIFLAQEVTRRLGRAGARVEVQAVGWSGMVADVLQPGRFQAAVVEHVDGQLDGDPSVFWSADGAFNFGRWRSERAEAQLDRVRASTTQAARRAAWRDWQAIFEAEAPAVLLSNPRLAYWVSEEVRGASFPAVIAAPRDRFARIAEWHVFTRRAPGRF